MELVTHLGKDGGGLRDRDGGAQRTSTEQTRPEAAAEEQEDIHNKDEGPLASVDALGIRRAIVPIYEVGLLPPVDAHLHALRVEAQYVRHKPATTTMKGVRSTD